MFKIYVQNLCFHLFTGEVRALKSLWILGDKFVNEIFHALPGIKTEAITSKSKIPYVYETYNVFCFAANPLSHVRNALARLTNALIKALNDHNQLPRFILVVPNNDLLEYIRSYKGGITTLTGVAINWIANQMIRGILAKKEALKKVRPGSVTPYEPKIVWVKMLEIPDNLYTFTAAQKFNKVIEKILVEKENHYLIDLHTKMNNHVYFNKSNLNGAGQVHFWKSIDDAIEDFDFHRVLLKTS